MILTKINVWGNNLWRWFKAVWLQDKIILILFTVGLFANLILYVIMCLGIKPTTEPVILHYSVYFGIDLIGQRYKVFLVPAVGSFIFLINFSLAVFFYKREKLISYLLSAITFFLMLLLVFAGVLLIWINY